jgi:preprotein translocase subunit Sss1
VELHLQFLYPDTPNAVKFSEYASSNAHSFDAVKQSSNEEYAIVTKISGHGLAVIGNMGAVVAETKRFFPDHGLPVV